MPGNIGKYQVLEEIGRGGFGIVYRAFDPTVHRTVALKILTLANDEDLLIRFRNEAAAMGRLRHPNIVAVYDFGESEDGRPYMVMPYLQGETLHSIIRSPRPLSLLHKVSIMSQVAEGLQHAHDNGIVHRDVKPPNIMVLPDESVQIMDFGIARMTASAHHTRTGFVVGTPHYMAPEQFLPGKTVDHRTDIWAFGVIYYELLSGRNPFAGAEDAATLYAIAHVEPPALTGVPDALAAVVGRLLAKDPDARYANLRDVQFDLQPVLLDLKRERAAQWMADARRLLAEDRLEDAEAAAKKALFLDPSDRAAHALLTSIRQGAPTQEIPTMRGPLPAPQRRSRPLLLALAGALAVGAVMMAVVLQRPAPVASQPAPAAEAIKPAPEPAAPAPAAVTPPRPERRRGALSWSGAALPPGGMIILSPTRVLQGGGKLQAGNVPPFTDVDLNITSPRGKASLAVTSPQSVVVTNTSGVPIYFVELSWETKQ